MTVLPSGMSISSGMPTGSSQDAEVTAHINAAIAFSTTSVNLDQQITALQIKQASGQATSDEIDTIATLQAQQIAHLSTAPDPTATNLVSPTACDISLSILQAKLLSDSTIASNTIASPVVNSSDKRKNKKTFSLGQSATTQTTGTSTNVTTLPTLVVTGNNGTTVFPPVVFDDLPTYITRTTFLNPWGRNRQCDDDLKDLCAFIQQDYKNLAGELKACTTNLAASTKP